MTVLKLAVPFDLLWNVLLQINRHPLICISIQVLVIRYYIDDDNFLDLLILIINQGVIIICALNQFIYNWILNIIYTSNGIYGKKPRLVSVEDD